MIKVFISEN